VDIEGWSRIPRAIVGQGTKQFSRVFELFPYGLGNRQLDKGLARTAGGWQMNYCALLNSRLF
jgi:hypothetical protein